MTVVTQYASPELIAAIAYDGQDPADDPAWPSSGAPDHATYQRWCRHLCGMACLRMALLHRDGSAPSLFELLDGARAHGAYTEDEDGDIHGLIYAPFATYARAVHRLDATVHPTLPLAELVKLLEAGAMVMVSVSKEIRRPELAPTRRGGHLVLAVGNDRGRVVFHNPSGHTACARTASLAAPTFARFFAHRGIALALGAPVAERATRQAASHPA